MCHTVHLITLSEPRVYQGDSSIRGTFCLIANDILWQLTFFIITLIVFLIYFNSAEMFHLPELHYFGLACCSHILTSPINVKIMKVFFKNSHSL